MGCRSIEGCARSSSSQSQTWEATDLGDRPKREMHKTLVGRPRTPPFGPFLRNSTKGTLEKGYLQKMVPNQLSNSRHICDNFAHPSSDVRNEIPAILRKFGVQFATNLRNAPFANAPFSGFLIFFAPRSTNQKIRKWSLRNDFCAGTTPVQITEMENGKKGHEVI